MGHPWASLVLQHLSSVGTSGVSCGPLLLEAGGTGLPPGRAQAFGTGQSQLGRQPLPWERPLPALLLLGLILEMYGVGCHRHGSIPGVVAPGTVEGFFSLSPLPCFIACDSSRRLQLPRPEPGLCVLLKARQWEEELRFSPPTLHLALPRSGAPQGRCFPGVEKPAEIAGKQHLGNRPRTHGRSPSPGLPTTKRLPEVDVTFVSGVGGEPPGQGALLHPVLSRWPLPPEADQPPAALKTSACVY